MFFYIAKIFANHFACGRRQLPFILQKKELQTSLYLQGTNMVGLGKVIGGAHTHTHTNNIQYLSVNCVFERQLPLVPPTLYIYPVCYRTPPSFPACHIFLYLACNLVWSANCSHAPRPIIKNNKNSYCMYGAGATAVHVLLLYVC